MFNGKPVIDVHGHMSTPPTFRAYGYNLVSLRTPGDELIISDAQMAPALDRHPDLSVDGGRQTVMTHDVPIEGSGIESPVQLFGRAVVFHGAEEGPGRIQAMGRYR